MHNNYLKAADKLRFALADLKKIIDETPCYSFEDRKALAALELMAVGIQSGIFDIEHYKQQAMEGILRELPNGRFELGGIELTCGNSMEVYAREEDEWFSGRVEYGGSYYFYCWDLRNPGLFEGMRARIRGR